MTQREPSDVQSDHDKKGVISDNITHQFFLFFITLSLVITVINVITVITVIILSH